MGSDEVIHSSDEEELSDILYIRPKKIILLFLEMWVTRKTFTWVAAIFLN